MIVTLGVYNNAYNKMIAIYYTADLRHVMAKEVRCMKKIKLLICKISGFILKIFGRGSNFPGELLLKLDKKLCKLKTQK